MNTVALAFYTGYAFCQVINVQHVIEEDALMVPFVVHWQGEQPTAIPYPSRTQEEAVALAKSARENQSPDKTGWSSGRDGLVTLSNGKKHDVLLIEASVPGLREPVALVYLYRRKPFTLVSGFNWKINLQARQTEAERKEFMADFQRGLAAHPFASQCRSYINNATKQ
ncbi:MAG: hypothetical protein LBI48_02385 [Burkholderiaceae bacterium]|nr:hypothetical protein [Burkholderiaceae bacterium]